MKQLQNNYTTPEQSRKLLAMGLPKDSADCRMYETYNGKYQISVHRGGRNNQPLRFDKSIPCWSVGRLIEIVHLCTGNDCTVRNTKELAAYMIGRIQAAIDMGLMDFSKLED